MSGGVEPGGDLPVKSRVYKKTQTAAAPHPRHS